MNEVKVTGKLKNIRIMTTKSGDRFVIGWFDQRQGSYFADGTGDREVYVFGINFVSFDPLTIDLSLIHISEPTTVDSASKKPTAMRHNFN